MATPAAPVSQDEAISWVHLVDISYDGIAQCSKDGKCYFHGGFAQHRTRRRIAMFVDSLVEVDAEGRLVDLGHTGVKLAYHSACWWEKKLVFWGGKEYVGLMNPPIEDNLKPIVYDLNTKRTRRLATKGEVAPLCGHQAVVTDSGVMVVAGGMRVSATAKRLRDGQIQSKWYLLDLVTQVWHTLDVTTPFSLTSPLAVHKDTIVGYGALRAERCSLYHFDVAPHTEGRFFTINSTSKTFQLLTSSSPVPPSRNIVYFSTWRTGWLVGVDQQLWAFRISSDDVECVPYMKVIFGDAIERVLQLDKALVGTCNGRCRAGKHLHLLRLPDAELWAEEDIPEITPNDAADAQGEEDGEGQDDEVANMYEAELEAILAYESAVKSALQKS